MLTKTAVGKLPLNQRIRWARKRTGLSQEHFAARIGTTRRHMIRIEQGQTKRPGPELLDKIAEATDQPRAFFDTEEDEGDAALATELLGLLRRVKTEARA